MVTNLEKFRSLMGQKCFVTTIANENIHQKLISYNKDILTFQSVTGGETNVPVRNLLYLGVEPTKLNGLFWSE